MSVQVDSSQYVNSHGAEPRGVGGWAFFFEGEVEPRFFHGRYADARKIAVAEARRCGVSRIVVGS